MLTSEEERNCVGESARRARLCLDIRNLVIKEILSDIEEQSPSIKELANRIRSELTILEMKKRETFLSVAGADAGSQILPLSSRRYAVISALVCSLPSGSCFFLSPESFESPYTRSGASFEGAVSLRRETKLFETALRFAEEHRETQLLLIDGPLAFSNLWGMAGVRNDQRRLTDAINGLLGFCREEDIIVAGIVKRPSARYLVHHLKLQDETDLSDSFLLLQALKPGERTEVFSPRAALRQAMRTAHFMDAIECPIYSFYGRFSGDWSIPPIRIDVPAFSVGYLDEIADYCYGTSVWNGIPLTIVRADEQVRISKRFMSEIYSEALTYVGKSSGEISQMAPIWGEGNWMRA